MKVGGTGGATGVAGDGAGVGVTGKGLAGTGVGAGAGTGVGLGLVTGNVWTVRMKFFLLSSRIAGPVMGIG